ncbi:6-carboxytetrahydropterin synthase [Marinobacterium sediminicola]|uniref:6-carboxy-5,6,7,8-tetrahydropterin synthase n=1 Tax=Marinobacterium sediminicola TaxID=518898 RepID=A0ABY1S471_9GAMM|nr:6-carboxytetrahydropterin synthase [Marinobacterium sediminicola]ULG68903.1 6-carboxytetrahydropterin synthase [Marinobacterium sediminicola]SMR77895.1 6-pyruvoyl tetrahydropterin synthase [Marinobacterium sediminicola]
MKLFVDNLTHVDFSYLHPERGLLGESWAVQLVLDGSLDEQGMICDFGVVKRRVKQWLDANVDHQLVVPAQMSGLKLSTLNGVTEVDWCYPDGRRFLCRAPEQAIAAVPVKAIDERSLAHWCRDQLLTLFPDQVRGVELAFVPESIDGHFYHYSHGLQQHDGNCQRIAHGHRSKIEIYRNGHRDEALEGVWAERFRDIYIGTRAHLNTDANGEHHYAYMAPQGAFELILPADCCYLIDTETTVEQIAMHLAVEIKADHPHDEVVVRAFEGIGKGAIATA